MIIHRLPRPRAQAVHEETVAHLCAGPAPKQVELVPDGRCGRVQERPGSGADGLVPRPMQRLEIERVKAIQRCIRSRLAVPPVDEERVGGNRRRGPSTRRRTIPGGVWCRPLHPAPLQPVQLARHAGAIVPAVEIHVVAKGDRRGEGGRGGGPGRPGHEEFDRLRHFATDGGDVDWRRPDGFAVQKDAQSIFALFGAHDGDDVGAVPTVRRGGGGLQMSDEWGGRAVGRVISLPNAVDQCHLRSRHPAGRARIEKVVSRSREHEKRESKYKTTGLYAFTCARVNG
mmetsp:Transcript_14496/g.47316  ORF Transcript_14496/g.47316 Transcript_14496/m.47316 type:complete len:285 (+) Transcript_14496:1427-2281(+)